MVSTEPSVAPPPDDVTAVDPDNRSFQQMSIRGPALIVLGIAVIIVIAGVVASAVDSGSSPTLTIHAVTVSDGTVVQLAPAATAMKSIVSAGEPPADILGNTVVPSGSTVTHTLNTDQNQSQFDRTVYFQTGLSSNQVVDAYHRVLPRLGWDLLYKGGASQQAGATEVLAKKGSGDGFYWEVGVVVSPTTSAGTTPFSVELYELPDDDS